MKKLFSILAAITISQMAWSQTSGNVEKTSISVGFRGGFSGSNMSKFALIESITPEFHNAYSAGGGIFVELPVYKNFSIQPELNYVQKGFKIKEGIDLASKFAGLDIPLNASVKMKLNYISVPVLAKIHMGNSKAGHYYLMAGPSINYLVDAGLKINVLNIFPVNTNFPKAVYKPFELGAVAAVGIEKPLNSKISIVSEARFEAGVSRVINMPVVQIPVRNRTVTGTIGLKIHM